ncbi:CDP-alcohol phosphatidyltransferase family protein [Aquisalimonas lutea]|uniref:CDP-alcohol phosphatidyltransferase family protein n=1 Tax=Aquisalimonas lutea TaxID=1327750 RepID=UPI0025B4DA10|nr:CDP-alcohol phosphatidyltransferase family protein [Aquisalimonas lutea]MDN3516206.1 CDP-alcohol phosphatidyltransferase family protein [Aquisalimonas lutea]
MYIHGSRSRRTASGAVPHRGHMLSLELLLALAASAGLAAAVYAVLPVPPRVPVAVMMLALAGAAGLFLLRAQLPVGGLGPASRVTLGRGVLALPLPALALHPEALAGSGAWLPPVLAAMVLVLDGVDGWLARRIGSSSAFGARFDMELDALVLLALGLLVWRTGLTGPWVLLIGAMRYAFVVAGCLLPVLRAPLPPSFRRKAACVIPGITLTAVLVPGVPAGAARGGVAAALLVLAGSFLVDVAWLLRHRHQGLAADARAATMLRSQARRRRSRP